MSKFSVRLRALREEAGMSQQDLADKVGKSKSSINMYERGEREPSQELQEFFADIFNVDLDFLLGRSEYRNRYAWLKSLNQSTPLPSNIIPLPLTGKKVPVLGTIACGEPILAAENLDGEIDLPEGVNADFALQCKGDSMIDARILDGDYVFIREQPMVENGEIAAVLIGDEATLKRVYINGDQMMLMAANAKYQPFTYSGDQLNNVRILGKAVWFLSKVQ